MAIRLSGVTFWAGGPAIVLALAGAIAVLSPPPGPRIGNVPSRLPSPDVVEAVGEGAAVARRPAARPADTEGGVPVVDSGAAVIDDGVPASSDVALGGGQDVTPAPDIPADRLASVTDPGGGIVVETTPSAKPVVGVPDGPAKRTGPRFDLVRVDRFGAAVIAGKAEPGSPVEISLDGAVIAEVVADARGAFVALFDMPQSEVPQVLTLASRDKDGTLVQSLERVFVMGREVAEDETLADATPSAPETPDAGAGAVAPDLPRDEEAETSETPEPVAPTVILSSETGVRVVQPPAPAEDAPDVMATVTLDLISYDDQGEVVLTGRSRTERHVRVYVDNKPVTTQTVAEDGSWQLSLPEVIAGRYTLRVDEIDDKGQVTSRIETPFQKEEPAKVRGQTASLGAPDGADGATPAIGKVTIQKGATLWELAEANYGDGVKYWQIYRANRDQIRNPDLIYPGQIFTIPE
jgi:nucleoid-associated protein YgaU